MNRKYFELCPVGCGRCDVKTVVTQVRCVLILELYEIIGFSLRCKCRETNISASYYYVYGPPLKCIGYTVRCGKFVEVPLPLLNESIDAFGRMAWSFMQGCKNIYHWVLHALRDVCVSWVKSRGVKLATFLHLVPSLRMSGSVPLFQCACMA